MNLFRDKRVLGRRVIKNKDDDIELGLTCLWNNNVIYVVGF